VVDLFDSQNDLKNRIIRCVGEPDKRFQEDALRMLRALRFAARFGFTIEPDTATAIHRNKLLLTHVAAERIREELTGLLCGSCVEPVLRQYHDVLSVPIPELAPLAGFKQYNRHHCHDIWGHTIAAVAAAPDLPSLRWAALLHDTGKPARFFRSEDGVGHFYGHAEESANIAAAVTARLRFDKASRDTIGFLVAHHHLFLDITEKTVKQAVLRFGKERLRLLLHLLRADTLGHSPCCFHHLDDIRTLEAMIAAIPDFTVKNLAVNGSDLLALGYEGAQIRQDLERLMNAVVFENIENKKETLLHHLNKT
jgi:tRNA nucleotidyltransferase (CCA-adding enzyme)